MNQPADRQTLEETSRRIRRQLVQLSSSTGAAHLGSALSCVDILVAAYWASLSIDPQNPDSPDRDRLILSKGHAAAAWYATLCERGFFSRELLETYARPGTKLAEHPSPGGAPGIEAATGSLGHGLPLGAGIATAGKLRDKPYRVCVVLSDGECNEGSVWEAAMFAAAQQLDRLVAVVDYNKWQATGRSNEVLALAPLREKWQAFGWNACEVDGHDPAAIAEIIRNVPDGSGKPVAVVAHTVKGKGVSFMEDDNNWHYRIPTEEEVQAAWQELEVA